MAVQAATSPISGVLGDKYDRTHIVAFGCFLWGVMTAVIGFSTSLRQARFFFFCVSACIQMQRHHQGSRGCMHDLVVHAQALLPFFITTVC